jgi:hypothetical protein
MERRYPERFYEPNFPVVFADEHAQFETLCQDIADRIADVEGSSSAAPVMSPGPRFAKKLTIGPLFFGFLLSFVTHDSLAFARDP